MQTGERAAIGPCILATRTGRGSLGDNVQIARVPGLKLRTLGSYVERLGRNRERRQINDKGRYRLARLAARYGPERPLSEVLAALSADCPARDPSPYDQAQGWGDGCGARYADLGSRQPPPDFPPGVHRLRLIEGGASSPAAVPPGHVPRWARNPRRAYDHDGREIRLSQSPARAAMA
jgi:hypothetical protein